MEITAGSKWHLVQNWASSRTTAEGRGTFFTMCHPVCFYLSSMQNPVMEGFLTMIQIPVEPVWKVKQWFVECFWNMCLVLWENSWMLAVLQTFLYFREPLRVPPENPCRKQRNLWGILVKRSVQDPTVERFLFWNVSSFLENPWGTLNSEHTVCSRIPERSLQNSESFLKGEHCCRVVHRTFSWRTKLHIHSK